MKKLKYEFRIVSADFKSEALDEARRLVSDGWHIVDDDGMDARRIRGVDGFHVELDRQVADDAEPRPYAEVYAAARKKWVERPGRMSWPEGMTECHCGHMTIPARE